MLIIKHGKIVTMANRLLDGGDILVDNGKIAEISEKTDYTPSRTDEVIDAGDCFVFPGFIDSHCRTGVLNDGIDDITLANNPIIPASGALYSVDFESDDFFECVKSGVTTVMVAPGSRAIVSGKCACIKTAKTRRKEGRLNVPGEVHILSEYTGMQCSLTGMGEAATYEQSSLIVTKLREELNAAVLYRRDQEEANANGKYSFISPTLENYIPLLSGNLPAFVAVRTKEETDMAIKIFQKHGIPLILVGCDECSELDNDTLSAMASGGVSVVFGSGLNNSSHGFRLLHQLEERGIQFAISTAHPETGIQYLPICAGLASREGISMDRALKAITVSAAEICGQTDRIGTLEVGKDADIVVFDANPLEVFTKTLFTIIDGEIVYRGK